MEVRLTEVLLVNQCSSGYYLTFNNSFYSCTALRRHVSTASAFELILARMAGSGSSGKSVMSVFRSLRLVRLFKMVKQWKSLHSLLNTMVRAASDVQSFGILFNLFVFVSLT